MQFCFSCEQGNEISSCRFLLLNNLYDIMGVCNVACHCVLAIRENKNSLSLKIGYSNAVYLYNRKYISPSLSHPIQYPNKPSKLQPHDFFSIWLLSKSYPGTLYRQVNASLKRTIFYQKNLNSFQIQYSFIFEVFNTHL